MSKGTLKRNVRENQKQNKAHIAHIVKESNATKARREQAKQGK